MPTTINPDLIAEARELLGDELLLSPSSQAWHDWFYKLGIRADSDVVQATATLVIAERENYAKAQITDTRAEIAAELTAIRNCILDGNEGHPTLGEYIEQLVGETK